MEQSQPAEISQITPNQEAFIYKLLKSSRILDKEFNMFKVILDKQVLTSYDASVYIEYLVSTLRFRRTFFNKKHKAYKFCYFCESRNDVKRYLKLDNQKEYWLCATCEINHNKGELVPKKIDEECSIEKESQ